MNENALSDLDDLTDLSYLSNAISYETDIAPHHIIEIFAGVGSGKTNLSTASQKVIQDAIFQG